jgi:hypothetical protein
MPRTTFTLSSLPGEGRLFVRLWTVFPDGDWMAHDVVYEREIAPPAPQPLTSRARSKLLEPVQTIDSRQRFLRSRGKGVVSARLWLGTRLGLTDIAGFEMPAQDLYCSALELPLGPVHARLWSIFEDGTWEFEDYELQSRSGHELSSAVVQAEPDTPGGS